MLTKFKSQMKYSREAIEYKKRKPTINYDM